MKVVAAILACLAALTSCSGEPEPPPLAEAARTLVSDGDAVVSSLKDRVTGLTQERADGPDRISACGTDMQRRSYVAKASFVDATKENPSSLVGILKGELFSRGYHDEIVDNLDLREDKTSVAVLVNPEAGLTYILFTRLDSAPNVVIVGKTECYPRGG
ncbi:hypothetical protein [Nonomuraea salmonea]|uniref:Lipoprotein n=1 Tax=Nonomuraea salmonea TaxID=46181 RepID=A0ABV5NJ30_9ACTN